MKKILNTMKKSVVVMSLTVLGVSAQAGLMISGTDVGQLDTVIGAINSDNSGQAYEEAQLEAAISNYTGTATNITLLTNVNTPSGFTTADGVNRFVNVNPATPGYYILKFGNGNDPIDMLFMLNNVSLGYLAWSDADMIANGIGSNHVQSLSHYAITNETGGGGGGGGGGSAPEPGSLALVGLALLGVGAARKRLS